jgi:hypothetical protein
MRHVWNQVKKVKMQGEMREEGREVERKGLRVGEKWRFRSRDTDLAVYLYVYAFFGMIRKTTLDLGKLNKMHSGISRGEYMTRFRVIHMGHRVVVFYVSEEAASAAQDQSPRSRYLWTRNQDLPRAEQSSRCRKECRTPWKPVEGPARDHRWRLFRILTPEERSLLG